MFYTYRCYPLSEYYIIKTMDCINELEKPVQISVKIDIKGQ